MRGQEKPVKSITLSGNVYLKYLDEKQISQAQVGDVLCYLNDEEELYPIIMGDYMVKGFKGYFKVKIFDGYKWCILDSQDFFEDRINQFSKTDICFYNYENCRERLEEAVGTSVYKTYREHYSTYLHQSNDFKGKKGVKKQK